MINEHPTVNELIDYLHHELPPEADAQMLLHLRSCRQCARRYEEEARLSETLRTYARQTERELPQGISLLIRERIARETRSPWSERFAALLRPFVAVPVAAAIAVAIYFGYDATHAGMPPKRTVIDAAYYLNDHEALARIVPFGEGSVVPSQLQNDLTN
jgi:anti-sigma factor RsiW